MANTIPPLSDGVRRYALALLVIIYTLNYLDRQVINILAEPIKDELQLADWQIGVMTGVAFALFYTLLGIPIARLAERRNRSLIIAGSTAVWSLFTVLCGAAQNFWQLVIARIGVGVGEAGCTPPAQSLIMDYSPPEKRSSALGIYGMGVPLGAMIGLGFGGIVADLYGWRVAFLLAGGPGLLIALLAVFTLPEPRRAIANYHVQNKANFSTFGETLRFLRKKRSFICVAAGCTIKGFIGFGIAPFTASYFLRSHQEGLVQVTARINDVFGIHLQQLTFMGLALGLLTGVTGVLGMWLGGVLGDRFGPKDVRRYLYTPALAALLAVPCYWGILLSPSVELALGLLAVHALLGSIWYASVYTAAFSVVPSNMRATSAALLNFIINLIGFGLGPIAIGALSDLFALEYGSADGLRLALGCATATGLIAAVVFWTGARTLAEDCVE